jgi:DNA-binding NarL/FixJ family response regulator
MDVREPLPALRVMVVDDEERPRRALRALLQTYPDISVVAEAENGRDAVRLVDERRPDVVIMDYSMPIMDGVEATRRIKAARPHTRVVLVTVYASAQPEARSAGADTFLLKGFSAEELIQALRPA